MYCRPFDDQSQSRIKVETDAFLSILERVEDREITLVSSDILKAEAKRIPNIGKRHLVELYLDHCGQHVPASLQIVRLAEDLVKTGQLKDKDAFHIASACHGYVRYFLTCDDRVLRKHELVARLTRQSGFEVIVLNPLEFLKQLESAESEGEGEDNHASD
jgi:hypothetical protein